MLDYCYFVVFILQEQNESKNEIHNNQEHDAFFGTSVLLIIISLADTRLDLILWFCASDITLMRLFLAFFVFSTVSSIL